MADEDSSRIQILEAAAGLQAIKNAEVDSEKLAELGTTAVCGHLERAQNILNACVETVISNKVNLFPPLAEQKDWDLPGTHLPIGATIEFGAASAITVASWMVLDESSGPNRLSCDLLCGLCSTSIVCFRAIDQLRR